jgi:hypothetical protein
MGRLTQTHTDNTRTCPYLSDDTLSGQTRTYAFKACPVVRCPDSQQPRMTGGLKFFEVNP